MKIYGIVGKSLQHSFSAKYFSAKFLNENIKNCVYQNFEFTDLKQFRNTVFNTPHLVGLNVTIPYKKEIISHIDSLSSEASEIGAINTISIDHFNKKLLGYNTDHIGFNDSLSNLNLLNKKALVLGTGGASLGIRYALGKRGIQYQMVSKNPGENQLGYAALNSLNLDEYQLIINTTPLGTFPNIDEFPNLPFSRINQQHIAYDLVYNPAKTLFLKNCQAKGAKVINGLKMLELQAEASWQIWNK